MVIESHVSKYRYNCYKQDPLMNGKINGQSSEKEQDI